MKALTLLCWLVLSAGLACAEDARVPQPRAKLDPAVRESVASTAAEVKGDGSAVVMDRFVVKGIAALPFVQRKEPVLQHEKFTLWRGGSFIDRHLGRSSVFIGIKPWFDIMEDDARFKHPAASRVNFTLFQIGR